MNCNCCFTDFIAKCNTSLQVYAQLTPLSDYTWVIADKHGNQYEGDFTTDSDGFWQIPVDQLPSGLLTQYSGEFTLQVQDAGCKPVKFKVAGEYDCINFTVRAGTRVKDNLGCSFDAVASEGAAPYKSYVAYITQTGTDNPTVNLVYNSLGADIVWERGNAGYYTGTLTSAFPYDKTIVGQSCQYNGSAINMIPVSNIYNAFDGYYAIYVIGNGNQVAIEMVDGAYQAVEMSALMGISAILVDIRVYP